MVAFWLQATIRFVLKPRYCLIHDPEYLKGDCYIWRISDHPNPQIRYKAVYRFGAHKQYLTRCVLSPDSQYALPLAGGQIVDDSCLSDF